MLDTGALQRNYIDPDVLADIEIKLADSRELDSVPKRRKMNAAVLLGDNVTVKRIDESVILTIAMPDAQGNGFVDTLYCDIITQQYSRVHLPSFGYRI